jgi:hypothetical protein
MKQRQTLCFLGVAVLMAGAALQAEEERQEPTAFVLIEQGNDHVGIDSKDKVVQIRSERSVGGMVPNIWYIVYSIRTRGFGRPR